MKTPELSSVIMDIKLALSQNPGPVKRIGVFGSLAKGRFTDNSDIDIAIEYEPGDDFDFNRYIRFCELCEFIIESISSSYGRKVDLVHVEERPGCLLHDIREEIVWV